MSIEVSSSSSRISFLLAAVHPGTARPCISHCPTFFSRLLARSSKASIIPWIMTSFSGAGLLTCSWGWFTDLACSGLSAEAAAPFLLRGGPYGGALRGPRCVYKGLPAIGVVDRVLFLLVLRSFMRSRSSSSFALSLAYSALPAGGSVTCPCPAPSPARRCCLRTTSSWLKNLAPRIPAPSTCLAPVSLTVTSFLVCESFFRCMNSSSFARDSS